MQKIFYYKVLCNSKQYLEEVVSPANFASSHYLPTIYVSRYLFQIRFEPVELAMRSDICTRAL